MSLKPLGLIYLVAFSLGLAQFDEAIQRQAHEDFALIQERVCKYN